MKFKYLTVLTIALALFLSACGKSDADITKAVSDKLAADGVAGVTAAVKGGVATLTGEVADATVKSKAEAAAKGVEGVKSVVNSITLKALPTPEPPADDAKLSGVINEALKKKNITGVTVSVSGGVVTLSGKGDAALKGNAQQAAAEAKPKQIINNINK